MNVILIIKTLKSSLLELSVNSILLGRAHSIHPPNQSEFYFLGWFSEFLNASGLYVSTGFEFTFCFFKADFFGNDPLPISTVYAIYLCLAVGIVLFFTRVIVVTGLLNSVSETSPRAWLSPAKATTRDLFLSFFWRAVPAAIIGDINSKLFFCDKWDPLYYELVVFFFAASSHLFDASSSSLDEGIIWR